MPARRKNSLNDSVCFDFHHFRSDIYGERETKQPKKQKTKTKTILPIHLSNCKHNDEPNSMRT